MLNCPSMCNFSLQYPYTAKLAFDGNQENDQWQDIAETVIWNTQVFERVPLSHAQISLCLKLNVLGCLAVGDLCSKRKALSAKPTSKLMGFHWEKEESLWQGLLYRYFTVFHSISRYDTGFFAGDEIYQGRAPSSAHELCNKCWKCEDPRRTS